MAWQNDGLLTRRAPNKQQCATSRYKSYANDTSISISAIINNLSPNLLSVISIVFLLYEKHVMIVYLAGFTDNTSSTMCYRHESQQISGPAVQPGNDLHI